MKSTLLPQHFDPDLKKITQARHHDPFQVLGKHHYQDQDIIRFHCPQAKAVYLARHQHPPFQRIDDTDIFIWQGKLESSQLPYRIQWQDYHNQIHEIYDPYSFPPQLNDFDLHLFAQGKHLHIYRFLGAHPHMVDHIKGILFAVWVPNVERVSVVGDFNDWDGRRHPMRIRGGSGVWELFIPELAMDTLYKFEIRSPAGEVFLKSDPYAQAFEMRPNTASKIIADSDYQWQDTHWRQQRQQQAYSQQAISIYELHIGSWQIPENGKVNYRQLATKLVDYVREMGFTHIELLPITEYPLDESWGYQVTGYFAPSSRYGNADDFRYFVDYCHQHHIGVIMDWVPAHFPKDAHGLARFNGSALYEHEDPRLGEHQDWGTLIFNYGRFEVKNFLISNAIYWLEEYHIDGLRVDAVASMLYLDYSREANQWLPNKYGGRENLEAIAFLQELNHIVAERFAGVMMIAEESTAWPQVTRPTWLGGLGFSMKWNMGWMNDTLEYMEKDPIYRHYHHDKLTFGLLYAFSENFVIALSHDEVVHQKRSLLNKMPGDQWQQFANLRLLYLYMFTYPGKKLLFMGGEFAQSNEWQEYQALNWDLLQYPLHQGIKTLVTDLNQLYKNHACLHRSDFDRQGFRWIDCHDSAQSILVYQRQHQEQQLIIILNFTPVVRHHYRIGLPQAGEYQEILNSDSDYYGGSNVSNGCDIPTENINWMNQTCSVEISLPPLAGIVLQKKSL